MADYRPHSFFEHCHRFLPILDADARDRTSVITKSTFLFSTVVAIAARYYDRETERQKIDGYRPLEKGMSEKCGELAMTHLRRVMLGSRFAVADIQAILLLASWRVGIHEHEVNEHLLVRCAGTILEQMGLGSILNQGIRSPKDISDESMKPLAPALRAWWVLTCVCQLIADGFLGLQYTGEELVIGYPQWLSVDDSSGLIRDLRSSTILPGCG